MCTCAPSGATRSRCWCLFRHRRFDGFAHRTRSRGIVLGGTKTEFKHMEYFYFHNCLHEGVLVTLTRFTDRTPTWDVLRKYPHDYKVVFVGDASMFALRDHGSRRLGQHVNERGRNGLAQAYRQHAYPHAVWLNPVAQRHWNYSESTTIIPWLFSHAAMFPITIEDYRWRDEGTGAGRITSRHSGGRATAGRTRNLDAKRNSIEIPRCAIAHRQVPMSPDHPGPNDRT